MIKNKLLVLLGAIVALHAGFVLASENLYSQYLNIATEQAKNDNDTLALTPPDPCLPDPNANRPDFMRFSIPAGDQKAEPKTVADAVQNGTPEKRSFLSWFPVKTFVGLGATGLLAGFVWYKFFRK